MSSKEVEAQSDILDVENPLSRFLFIDPSKNVTLNGDDYWIQKLLRKTLPRLLRMKGKIIKTTNEPNPEYYNPFGTVDVGKDLDYNPGGEERRKRRRTSGRQTTFLLPPIILIDNYIEDRNKSCCTTKPTTPGCNIISILYNRIRRIHEYLSAVDSETLTLNLLNEYINSIYYSDNKYISGPCGIPPNTIKDYLINLEDDILYKSKNYDHYVNISISYLEYLRLIKDYIISLINPEIDQILGAFEDYMIIKRADNITVRMDILIEYIRTIYNLYSYIFILKASHKIQLRPDAPDDASGAVLINRSININPITNHYRYFFNLKRQGDWGQVVACKRKGYTFVTFDRLAFVFAAICGIRCILQRRKPNDENAHHYEYICYKDEDTNYGDFVGNNVKCENLFQGKLFEYLYETYATPRGHREASLKKPNINEACKKTFSQTEENFREVLYITLALLDSWHDWKEGRGLERYEIEFNTLVNCLGFEEDIKCQMEAIYMYLTDGSGGGNEALLYQNNKTFKEAPPKSTFEANIIKGIENHLSRVNTRHQGTFTRINFKYVIDNTCKLKKGEIKTLGVKTLGEYPEEVQKFGIFIHRFFKNNAFLVDALQSSVVFKYLTQHRDCKFYENFYTQYDAATSKIGNEENDGQGADLTFTYCRAPGSSSVIKPEHYSRLKKVSKKYIVDEHSKDKLPADTNKCMLKNVSAPDYRDDRGEYKTLHYRLLWTLSDKLSDEIKGKIRAKGISSPDSVKENFVYVLN